MNKLQVVFLVVLIMGLFSYAQVGIGTPAPHSSAMLDLVSTDRGFLPPRMTEVDRDNINNPAEGLLVYNTTAKCLQANMSVDGSHQWSVCLTGADATGNANGDTGADASFAGVQEWSTNLRFKEFYSNSSGIKRTTAVTKEGNAYAWGANTFGYLTSYVGVDDATFAVGDNPSNSGVSTTIATPLFINDPIFNGKVKSFKSNDGHNFFVLTTEGKLYGWGSEALNILDTGFIGDTGFNTGTRRAVEIPMPSSATATDTFKQIALGDDRIVALTTEGKLFWRGRQLSGQSNQSQWSEIPAPTGVTSYKDFVSHGEEVIGNFYLTGSDDNLYSVGGTTSGGHDYFTSLVGNPAFPNTSPTTLTATITQVSLPAGHAPIVEVMTNDRTVIALASDGKAYGWGHYKIGNIAMYLVISETDIKSYSSWRFFDTPKQIAFPTGVTSFTQITTGDSLGHVFYVGDNGKTYMLGSPNSFLSTLLLNDYTVALEYKEVLSFAGYGIAQLERHLDGLGFITEDGIFYGAGKMQSANFGATLGNTAVAWSPTYIIPTQLINGNLDPNNTTPEQ